MPPVSSQPLTLGLILSEKNGPARAAAARQRSEAEAARKRPGSPGAPPPDLAAAADRARAAHQADPYAPADSPPLRLGYIIGGAPDSARSSAPPAAAAAAATAAPSATRPLTLGRIMSERRLCTGEGPGTQETPDIQRHSAGEPSVKPGAEGSVEYHRQLAYRRRNKSAKGPADAGAADAAASVRSEAFVTAAAGAVHAEAAPPAQATQSSKPLSLREIRSQQELAIAGRHAGAAARVQRRRTSSRPVWVPKQ